MGTSYYTKHGHMSGRSRAMVIALRLAWMRGQTTMMITSRQCRRIPRKEDPGIMIIDEAAHISLADWKKLEKLVKGDERC